MLNDRVRDGIGWTHAAMSTKRKNKQVILGFCLTRVTQMDDYKKWLSPRPISTGQLNTLPCLHPQPINPVVSRGSYSLNGMGTLILKLASHLDAFSAYPDRT